MLTPNDRRPTFWHWLFAVWVVVVYIAFFMQFRPYADVILRYLRTLLAGG